MIRGCRAHSRSPTAVALPLDGPNNDLECLWASGAVTTNSTPGWCATISNDAFNCSVRRAPYGRLGPFLCQVEAFRKSVAFVANGDKKAVDARSGDVDPYVARALALIGVLCGVRHQLIDDQRRRNRAIGRNYNASLRLNVNFALPEARAEVFADGFDVSSDVETLDVRRLIQLLVYAGDRAHSERGVFKLLRESG